MERDLIFGYGLLKLASLLGMYLHQRSEAVDPMLLFGAVAGGLAGLFFLARSWTKARDFAK